MIFAAEKVPDVEDAWRGILYDRIPRRWLLFSYPTGTQSLAYFLQNLKDRFNFSLRWGEVGGVMKSYWLPGFYQQQAFFNAFLQMNSSRLGVEWRTLALDFEITRTYREEDLQAPPDGVIYVYGLFLEGAMYDLDEGLVEPPLEKKFREMPLILVRCANSEQVWARDVNDEKCYRCPVYKVSLGAMIGARVDCFEAESAADAS